MNSPEQSEESKSKDKPKILPPPEWLEMPSITRGVTIPTSSGLRSGREVETTADKIAESEIVIKDAIDSASGPIITPEPPLEIPAEKEGPPKCPHCGTVLTQAQLDLKATGTKVLCSECFNMV